MQKKIKKIEILLIFIFVLMMFSCPSSIDYVPPYIPPLAQVLSGNIEALLQKKEYLQTLQIVNRMLSEKSVLPLEKLQSFQLEALAGAERQFQDLIKDAKYSEALAIYLSLKQLGEEKRLLGWDKQKLYLACAEKSLIQGHKKVALLYYLNVLTEADLSAQQLNSIARLAAECNEKMILAYLIELLEKRRLPVEKTLQDKINQVYSLSQMLNGTVTIWVDKGMKIEGGVGIPDRVIGSGFFIDERGYLLTNYHLIESEVSPKYEGFSRLYIKLSEKPEYKIPATVVGYDVLLDLALIKVPVEPKYIFPILRKAATELGERVTVIGSPLGLPNTATSGIVSALERRFLQLGDAIQIDAPINPGNSGGPVVDQKGNLIGIVFAGVQQFQGINFAVAGDWIKSVLNRLYSGGEVKHLWAGMSLAETEKGLEVVYVVPGEPASNAGLQSGDLIQKLNGEVCKKIKNFQSITEFYEHPILMKLELERAGKKIETLLYLTYRPTQPVNLALERDSRINLIYPLFGMKLERITDSPRLAKYFVRRVLPNSTADEIGISETDQLNVNNWYLDKEKKIVAIEIIVKRHKLGYLETYLQLISLLELDSFV